MTDRAVFLTWQRMLEKTRYQMIVFADGVCWAQGLNEELLSDKARLN